MNDTNDRDEMTQFLLDRGHTPDEIEKIKLNLSRYDSEVQHDSIFDSVASGDLDLDAIILEALADPDPS